MSKSPPHVAVAAFFILLFSSCYSTEPLDKTEKAKAVKYEDYMPKSTKRKRESTEWSITYSYNTDNKSLPRVLLIGDSICNGYQSNVKEFLENQANVSFWASSKCVTDPDYFKELDLILSSYHYDYISFNNGLHSLNTFSDDFEEAFYNAILFILDKNPDCTVFLINCTPLKSEFDSTKNKKVSELNQIISNCAQKTHLSLVDLFHQFEREDRLDFYVDEYHFNPKGKEIQAKLISDYIKSQINNNH